MLKKRKQVSASAFLQAVGNDSTKQLKMRKQVSASVFLQAVGDDSAKQLKKRKRVSASVFLHDASGQGYSLVQWWRTLSTTRG